MSKPLSASQEAYLAQHRELIDSYYIPGELVEEVPEGWPSGWAIEEPGEPILVLGYRTHHKPAGPRKWHVIEHQTGGICCFHHRMWATLLTPRPGIFEKMKQLEERWYETNAGRHSYLELYMAYRASLIEIFGDAVDCNRSFRFFEEAIYPIDNSREVLRQLCSDDLPDDFSDLVGGGWPAWHNYEGVGLYVLGANSD